MARRGVVPDAVPTAGGLGTMGWPQWDAATRSWHRAHGAAKPGDPSPQQGAWGGDPLNPPRLGVRVAPLWHWDLTDHHCGIIIHFQPHEQKQGPEPPAVGTRGQRDTPIVPSPPPSDPRGDLGHPNVCRCRVRSRPRPISREGSGVFWPDTHGPTSPHGAEMLLGGRGHTQLMGRGLHIRTSPPRCLPHPPPPPPNYLTWRLRRFGDTPMPPAPCP